MAKKLLKKKAAKKSKSKYDEVFKIDASFEEVLKIATLISPKKK